MTVTKNGKGFFQGKLMAQLLYRRLVARSSLHVNSFRSFSSSSPPHPSESFLNGTNNRYVEDMYTTWLKTPSKVHSSWDLYFKNVNKGAVPGAAFLPPPTIMNGISSVNMKISNTSSISNDNAGVNHALALSNLIRSYQLHGHHSANLDPLGLAERKPEPDFKKYGFTEADMDLKVTIPANLYVLKMKE